jgi:hypothetical protein
MMEFVIGNRARRTTNIVSIHPDNKADQAPGTRKCPLYTAPFVPERDPTRFDEPDIICACFQTQFP